ncbi:YceI family protein [Halpernia sp. GG3]
MKKLVLGFFLIGSIISAQTKKVINSDVHWWGYKVVKSEASSHDGILKMTSGNVVMKGNNIVGGTFLLDMTSINDQDLNGEYQAKLNDHLKTGEFFETAKYPTASYTITSVTKNNDKMYPYLIKGNLTAKGIKKTVNFPAIIGVNKGLLTLKSNKFSFNRQDFGIAYQSTMKDVFVKDDVDLQINLQAK